MRGTEEETSGPDGVTVEDSLDPKPGTEDKIRLMAWRWENKQPLFYHTDQNAFDDGKGND